MSKHILFISRCPPYPLHFGDRLILWHLARLLQGRGYTLDLLALTQQASDDDDILYYADLFCDIQLLPETTRTQWMYLKRLLGTHHPQASDDAWQSDLWQAIENKLSQEEYDLVHVFGGVQVYEFAHLLRDYPTVITPYESYSLYLKRALKQSFSPMTWLNRQLTRQFEGWMFSPYDRTVVLTDDDRAELHGINPNLSIDVIPNGIDLTDFAVQSTERDNATLLFVGNYAYPPNHSSAMLLAQEIFPKIAQVYPDAQLQLVGNAPSEDMLAIASDTIIVTGRVPKVQKYLAQATIFLCPLQVGAGIKNKVLEALAMGIPTIATPLSMEGISAVEGQHILVRDVDNIATTAIELLKNRALQQHLSQNAPQLIMDKYSWDGVVTQYERLYDAIIAKQ